MNTRLIKKINFWNFILFILIIASLIIIFRDFIPKRSIEKQKIKYVLQLAGPNRTELEQVLKHYKPQDDIRKLKAAEFLISNCYIYSNRSTEIFDDFGNPVVFDPTIYDRKLVVKSKDSILRKFNPKRKITYDCRTLSSNYLIKHIEKSFEVWEKSPWHNQINFNQFCNYILPYRALNEPLSDWNIILYEKYRNLVDTIIDKSILNTTSAINLAIASDLQYDNRWVTGGLGVQGIPHMLQTGSGMCDDLAVFGVAAMRSFGIPSTIDFTIWARTNMGHAWCVVFNETGKPWSFGPGEQQPGEHIKIFKERKYRTLGKVFRYTFRVSNESYLKEAKDLIEIPPFFRAKNIVDVTHEYVKTFSINTKLDENPEEHEFAYLCVWNQKQWKPIDYGIINRNDSISFHNVGGDNVYLICYYINGLLKPSGHPFILNNKGVKIDLNYNSSNNNNTIRLTKIAGLNEIAPGGNYLLKTYKDGNWQEIEPLVPIDNYLYLKKMKEKTLYLIDNMVQPGKQSRPFTIQNDTCVIW